MTVLDRMEWSPGLFVSVRLSAAFFFKFSCLHPFHKQSTGVGGKRRDVCEAQGRHAGGGVDREVWGVDLLLPGQMQLSSRLSPAPSIH